MPLLDFAIITALPEEFRYLRKILPPLREITESITWYRTRIAAPNGRSYEIVLTYQDQMGPLDAHDRTMKVIDRWDPAYILLVGIAGGFQEWVNLGDVIVGQQIFHYDPKAVTDERIEYRPAGYPGGVALVRQVHAVSVADDEFEQWQTAAKQRAAKKAKALKLKTPTQTAKARDALRAHAPSIHVGTVASGTDVVKSEKKKKELLRLHGLLLGTEMEGCGMMHAAFFHRDTPAQALLIKGMSDASNADKSKLDAFKFWRELAVENSATLALAVMARGRLEPQRTDEFEIDFSDTPISVIRDRITGSLRKPFTPLGFQRLVSPLGPLTELTIAVRVEAAGKELPIVRGVIEFSTRGERRQQEWKAGDPPVHVSGPIDRLPVGVYVLLERAAERAVFTVRTGSRELTREWVPGLDR